jgi:hypothetical protein
MAGIALRMLVSDLGLFAHARHPNEWGPAMLVVRAAIAASCRSHSVAHEFVGSWPPDLEPHIHVSYSYVTPSRRSTLLYICTGQLGMGAAPAAPSHWQWTNSTAASPRHWLPCQRTVPLPVTRATVTSTGPGRPGRRGSKWPGP